MELAAAKPRKELNGEGPVQVHVHVKKQPVYDEHHDVGVAA